MLLLATERKMLGPKRAPSVEPNATGSVYPVPKIAETSLDDSAQSGGVAVCIAGNLRTFTDPDVFSQIRPFYRKLFGFKRPLSFFLYGTLTGAGPKNQTLHNLPAINEYNETALNLAMAALRPAAVELVQNAEDVTEENLGQYVRHLECFRQIRPTQTVDGVEAFFENPERFRRGLNQLAHMLRSLEMMMAHEEANSVKYRFVILTRPDLKYDQARLTHELASIPSWLRKGQVVLQMDHWTAMPRPLAQRFHALGKVLSCSPQEECCRKIDRSESLWEYLTGAVHGNFGRCACSNITTPYTKVIIAQIQRTFHQ